VILGGGGLSSERGIPVYNYMYRKVLVQTYHHHDIWCMNPLTQKKNYVKHCLKEETLREKISTDLNAGLTDLNAGLTDYSVWVHHEVVNSLNVGVHHKVVNPLNVGAYHQVVKPLNVGVYHQVVNPLNIGVCDEVAILQNVGGWHKVSGFGVNPINVEVHHEKVNPLNVGVYHEVGDGLVDWFDQPASDFGVWGLACAAQLASAAEVREMCEMA